MSARIPVRRLQPALAALRPRSACWVTSTRAFSNSLGRPAEDKKDQSQNKEKDVDLSNPILENYLANHKPSEKPKRPEPKTGDLSETSIFKPEFEIPGYKPRMTPEELAALKLANKKESEKLKLQKEKDLQALSLDPVPEARRSYERQLVIRSLQKKRVSKKIRLKRTEREMVYKSQPFPTSVKKMMRLMHQIQGKTVEEALIQMRFSKKRVARDIVKGLQLARDEAIAARGMGLGAGVPPAVRAEEDKQIENGWMTEAERTQIYLADGTRRRDVRGFKPKIIELKDGSKKTVTDLTEMYIDRAWATKGPETKSPEYRARGRINILTHRTAKFNVQLKEEKTRVRISEEIKKKRENRPLWLALPDRPVTAQRQYCLW